MIHFATRQPEGEYAPLCGTQEAEHYLTYASVAADITCEECRRLWFLGGKQSDAKLTEDLHGDV